MIIGEIPFFLKDGRPALLRGPRDEDIPGMLEYLRLSAAETEFILRYPEECDRYTPEFEKQMFEHINQSPNEAMLVCLADQRVVGTSNIVFNRSLKTRHRGTVAIALIREYWGLGIGTRMFSEMIRIAKERGCVTQLELDYIEGNTRARALYDKMGFRPYGIRPNAIRLKDGTMLNECLMLKEL